MLLSMTGYGKESCNLTGKSCTIEIKAVNSKNLDLSVRIPSSLKSREMELRKLVSSELIRGKVDLNISISNIENEKTINIDAAKSFHKEITALSKKLDIKQNFDVLGQILKMPEVYKVSSDELNDSDWKKIYKSVKKASKELLSFRKQEGLFIGKDILLRIDKMNKLMDEISKHEAERINNLRNRIEKNITKSLSTEKVDKDRLEQELVHYLEKLDITEERIRFNGHCKYFKTTANSKVSNGKKLGFVAQEIGREINTIGSKSPQTDVTKHVVEMKDELEKIREQVQNIL